MAKRRIYFVFFLFCLFGAILIYRLYFLQIKKGDYYRVLALGQQISIDKSKGSRGEIFFRDKKRLLAQNIPELIIYIVPSKILDKAKTTQFLAKISGLPQKIISNQLEKKNIFHLEVPRAQLSQLKTNSFQGIYWQEFSKRIYPQHSLAAQVVGFSNVNGEGQYGIEGYYNSVLEGKSGFEEKNKTPFGYAVPSSDELNLKTPKRGDQLVLTLDFNIQYFAQKLLQEASKKWHIDSGQIIVENPLNGEILALANFPSFDLNDYQKERKLGIFLNGAIQKLFEPGSVFKAFTMAAGLEEGAIKPDTTYTDKGYVKLGGMPIYNYDRKVWGKETMTEVLEKSINTGAVFVENKIGKSKFLKYLDQFGCFRPTGIDLQGEIWSLNEDLKQGYPRDIAAASFGQGINVTPIRLIAFYSALANKGIFITPHLVKEIIGPSGQARKFYPKNKTRIIPLKTANQLTAMLTSVVNKGFGRKAEVKGYSIAGKTGTAQVPLKDGKGYDQSKTIQSFIGYFPAFNPKFVILIKLDDPKDVHSSEYSATPLFHEMAKYIIDLLAIPPDLETPKP